MDDKQIVYVHIIVFKAKYRPVTSTDVDFSIYESIYFLCLKTRHYFRVFYTIPD